MDHLLLLLLAAAAGASGGATAAFAATQRLPLDFEPFFALDARTQRGETSSSHSASTSVDTAEGGIRSRVKDLAFQGCFAVFSSRHWDRLYLLLALSLSVLCPGYMDGAIPVERTQLATLLLVMFAAAAVPAVLAAILKMFFFVRLRSRLVRDDRRRFAVRGQQLAGERRNPVKDILL